MRKIKNKNLNVNHSKFTKKKNAFILKYNQNFCINIIFYVLNDILKNIG